MAKLHPGCTPQGHAEGAQALGQPQGAPGPGSGHRGQAFGEDTATAGTIAAKPLADAELKAPIERIFQGPVADALTHIGQIAMLRRLAGGPMRAENYHKADIAMGRVGAGQTPPKREFD